MFAAADPLPFLCTFCPLLSRTEVDFRNGEKPWWS